MMIWIALEPDDDGTYLVTCPALPEVTTFGETAEDAARHAVDAIEEALAARIARGAELPTGEAAAPPAGAEARQVTLPALVSLKVLLAEKLRLVGITRAELARRLGWNRTSVDRLFQLGHASRIEQIEAAVKALGLVIRTEIVEPEAA